MDYTSRNVAVSIQAVVNCTAPLCGDKVMWILSVMQAADERASSLEGRMESLQSELRTAQSGLKAGAHRARELETLLGEQHSAHSQV